MNDYSKRAAPMHNSWQFGVVQADAAWLAHVPSGISGSRELFEQLDKELTLPDYFGMNWDALEECLRELTWLPAGIIVIQHDDIPLAAHAQEQRIYIAILRLAILRVTELDPERRLIVVFPETRKDRVLEILSQSYAWGEERDDYWLRS